MCQAPWGGRPPIPHTAPQHQPGASADTVPERSPCALRRCVWNPPCRARDLPRPAESSARVTAAPHTCVCTCCLHGVVPVSHHGAESHYTHREIRTRRSGTQHHCHVKTHVR